jgi:hypothetical protein
VNKQYILTKPKVEVDKKHALQIISTSSAKKPWDIVND